MNLNSPESRHKPSPEILSVVESGVLHELANTALAGTDGSLARIAAHEANMVQKNRRLLANSRNITLFEAERRSQLDPND